MLRPPALIRPTQLRVGESRDAIDAMCPPLESVGDLVEGEACELGVRDNRSPSTSPTHLVPA